MPATKLADRYKVAEIEAAADTIVWCSDEAPGFQPSRLGDLSYVGNIVQAMVAYASGELGSAPISMQAADRIIAIGSDRMMAAVAAARHQQLAPYLKVEHFAVGSINSPMQCMMKEICAQCLQPQRILSQEIFPMFFLLQSGSAVGSGRFQWIGFALASEQCSGETDEPLDRPLSATRQ